MARDERMRRAAREDPVRLVVERMRIDPDYVVNVFYARELGSEIAMRAISDRQAAKLRRRLRDGVMLNAMTSAFVTRMGGDKFLEATAKTIEEVLVPHVKSMRGDFKAFERTFYDLARRVSFWLRHIADMWSESTVEDGWLVDDSEDNQNAQFAARLSLLSYAPSADMQEARFMNIQASKARRAKDEEARKALALAEFSSMLYGSCRAGAVMFDGQDLGTWVETPHELEIPNYVAGAFSNSLSYVFYHSILTIDPKHDFRADAKDTPARGRALAHFINALLELP